MEEAAATIRLIQESDAEKFLALKKRLDEETKFMMLEPGERRETFEQTSEHIRQVLGTSNQAIFAAEMDGALVGYASVEGGCYRRNRATGYIVAGVLQRAAGRGVGTRLFAALIDWARQAGLHRLELTVMTHNERAVALYKKMGFEIEGVKRENLLVDGAWIDEYSMARLLS